MSNFLPFISEHIRQRILLINEPEPEIQKLSIIFKIVCCPPFALLTCDNCGCLTLDQGIRSHGVDTS